MSKWITLIVVCASFISHGQSMELSPQAEISVITCGPGQGEAYTAFGHAAIRIVDPIHSIDYAYNYGVFDFSQPNFYLNYTKGLLLFKLGVYPYPDFVNSYVYYGRWVTEQMLDLSQKQKQDVFNFLEWNALPENETYRYDYFYNNCANKVRDVFVQILGDSLRFDGSYITTQYTIRQLTDLCLKEQPWGDLGIDICLGLPMDKKATPYEYMFLPDFLQSSFDHATIRKNGHEVPIVKQKVPVFKGVALEVTKAPVHPLTVMLTFLALTLGLSIYDWKRKKPSLWFDLVVFSLVGVVGILLLVLWTATDHQAASNNFNLLWALPTHVIVLGLLFNKARPFIRKYFLGVAILTGVLLLTWTLLPQQMHMLLLPLVASLGLRAFLLSRKLT